ncbi:MAG: YbhB/YbcL family Raf kinase inhibitor-like protein [Terriglobia bacterium]
MRNSAMSGLDLYLPLRFGRAIVPFALMAVLAWGAVPSRRDLAAGAKLRLETLAFRAEGFIPGRYTCSGANVSPALRWNDVPAGTRSFALIVTDPDAPARTWVHWVVFNLPPGARSLPERVPKEDEMPGGGVQGVNDFHFAGYGGPCPPPGKPHRYFFRLYALNIRLSLKPGSTREEVRRGMKGHVLAEAALVGRYGR